MLVLEQAPALGEVGAGVQIGANGMCVLDHLGLWPALKPLAWQPEGKRIYHFRTGESWPLYDLGADSVERYGFPYCMFHRADLHAVLAEAVAAAQPDAIRLNAKLADAEQDGSTRRRHSGNTANASPARGSPARTAFIRWSAGPCSAPTIRNSPASSPGAAWVPTAGLPPQLLEPQSAIWIGPGGHCVHYQLRNGELMNFVGAIERSDWRVESWNTPGTVAECLRDFAGWNDALRSLIRAIPTTVQMGAPCAGADGRLVEGAGHAARRRLPRHPALPRPGAPTTPSRTAWSSPARSKPSAMSRPP